MIRPIEERRRNTAIAGMAASAATGAIINGGLNYMQQKDTIKNLTNMADLYSTALQTAKRKERPLIQQALDGVKNLLGDGKVDKKMMLKAAGVGAALTGAVYVLFNGIGYVVNKAFTPKQKYILINLKDKKNSEE